MENRVSSRFPCRNIINYSIIRPDGAQDSGHNGYVTCRDISEKGLGFTAWEIFPAGTMLAIKFRQACGGAQLARVMMTGEILWCKIAKDPKKFDAGARIQVTGGADIFKQFLSEIQKN
jgi:hypothetical protein